MHKAIAFLVFLYVGLSSAFTQLDPPELRCLDVKANGDVELTWIIPADPGGVFDAYQVYYSTSLAGPYNLVGTVAVYAQNTFTHVGSNAAVQSVYYYVVTRSDAPGYLYSSPSDTLATILVNAANPLNGTAPLTWNELHTPSLATSQDYEIFYEYPATVWNFAGSTTSLSFIDTIDICNDLINFRVEQDDASGCSSVSAVDGDIYQNLIPPDIPQLDSVSVDDVSQNAALGWQSSEAGDTEGYIIYQFIGGVWTPIDTVWGIGTTYYENTTSDADTQSESYCIAAIDSCGVTSPLTPGHSTILLGGALDICADEITLNWTHYTGFNTGVDHYEVMVSENSGAYSLVETLDDTISTTVFNGLNDASTYCFFIIAESGDGITSSSNFICFTINKPATPSYIYIRTASVNNDEDIEIRWEVDETVQVDGYELQRSTSFGGPWTALDYQLYNGSSEFTYTDQNVNADKQDYFYQLAVIDSCGNEAMYSNMARTILLTADPYDNLTNELLWNDYEGWPSGVDQYWISRTTDGVADPFPLTIVAGFLGWYNDDLTSLIYTQGNFSYRLMAIESFGNPYGYTDTVWSNGVSLQQIPRLFIPNAFAPNGVNQIFIPFGVFIDHESYSLIIFNELGEEMFSTNDFFEGWDGTNDGAPAPPGVYNYILKLVLPGGVVFEKMSHVTLIR
ncbi:MAG: hypothetical protein C0592_07030 [Marinilabiliales bacterium]|nr:MAG: hypothetical protein C0592_07030 [Marinilabiliales bacterium]